MRLGFVFFPNSDEELLTSKIQPLEVTIEGNLWRYKKGTRYEQCLNVGSGVRIPDAGENKEFWGIGMVIDLDNPKHLEARDKMEEERLAEVLS
ncbi:MAG: hypothetical protein KAR00_01910 [Candidatus Pacebacteria bacterium]|nr:hypothetical protein [Candidatus Paceibacterota bacterium]